MPFPPQQPPSVQQQVSSSLLLLEIPCLAFASWTLAYQLIFVSRYPSAWTPMTALGAFVLAFVALLLASRTPERHVLSLRLSWPHIAILSMSAAYALFGLFSSRPNGDDPLYFHRTAWQLRHLAEPFTTTSTIHNSSGIYEIPIYFMGVSYEVLCSFTAKFLSIDPLWSYQNLGYIAAALLIPPTYYALYREFELTRTQAAAAVAAALVFLLLDGRTGRTIGSFSLLHLWQGKSILIALLLPLGMLFTIRAGRQLRLRTLLPLLAVQICAYGLSSTGLILMPMMVFFTSAAHFGIKLINGGKKGMLGRCIVTALSINLTSLYSAALLFVFVFGLNDTMRTVTTIDYGSWTDQLALVFGKENQPYLRAALIGLLPLMTLRRKYALLLIGMAALEVILLFNPFLGNFIAHRTPIYWRMAYLAPVVCCAGLIGAFIVQRFQNCQSRTQTAVLAILVIAMILPAKSILSRSPLEDRKLTSKGMEGYRLEADVAPFCLLIREQIAQRNILAPPDVAWTLPLVQDTVVLEAGKPRSTKLIFADNGMLEEGLRRLSAQEAVNAAQWNPKQEWAFRQSLANGIDAVVSTEVARAKLEAVLHSTEATWHRAASLDEWTLYLLDE